MADYARRTADYEDDDVLSPRETDSDEIREVLENISNCVGVNVRGRKAYREIIDRICLQGLKHRDSKCNFDEDAESLFTRYGIPLVRERKDIHPGKASWRPWVTLHIAPTPKYYDAESHPDLITNIANTCWAFEELRRINPNAIKKPSEGILHPALGDGSAVRFSNVPHAWWEQIPISYDKNVDPTKVPPAELYPPPAGKAPIGTEQEGIEVGRQVGKEIGLDSARRNTGVQIPPAPLTTPDGRPYSAAWRRGYDHGARSTANRNYDIARGEIEGRHDTHRRAIEDVHAENPPLRENEIQPEMFGHDAQGWQQTRRTAYIKAGFAEYMQTYVSEEARLRKIRADAEKESIRKTAEAERQKAQAEDREKKARQAQQQAEERAKKAEDRARKDALERQKAEEQSRKEAAARHKLEVAARREAEEKSKREARERDRQHRQNILSTIIGAFNVAGLPLNYSKLATTAIERGAIQYVKINY